MARFGTLDRNVRCVHRTAARDGGTAAGPSLAIALGVAVALSGCGLTQLTPTSEVIRNRVAGVWAEPPEIAPGETTALRALLVHPLGAPPDIGALWFACVAADGATGCLDFNAGSVSGDDDSAAGGFDPSDLQFGVGETFHFTASGASFDAAWAGLSDEDKVEGLSVFVSVSFVPRTNAELQALLIEIGTAAFSGDTEEMERLTGELQGLFEEGITAARRVTISDKSAAAPGELRCATEHLRPNRNPAIEGLRLHVADEGRDEGVLLGGTTYAAPGSTLILRPELADGSVEDYVYVTTDGVTECRRETPWFAWMTNAGSLGRDYSYLADPGDLEEVAGRPKINRLHLPEAAEFSGPLDLWVVARDRRGGMTWFQHRVAPLEEP